MALPTIKAASRAHATLYAATADPPGALAGDRFGTARLLAHLSRLHRAYLQGPSDMSAWRSTDAQGVRRQRRGPGPTELNLQVPRLRLPRTRRARQLGTSPRGIARAPALAGLGAVEVLGDGASHRNRRGQPLLSHTARLSYSCRRSRPRYGPLILDTTGQPFAEVAAASRLTHRRKGPHAEKDFQPVISRGLTGAQPRSSVSVAQL